MKAGGTLAQTTRLEFHAGKLLVQELAESLAAGQLMEPVVGKGGEAPARCQMRQHVAEDGFWSECGKAVHGRPLTITSMGSRS